MIKSVRHFIPLLIVLSSCVADEGQYCSYVTYVNETSKTVTIEGFFEKKTVKTLSIQPYEKQELLLNAKSISSGDFFFGATVDSVTIKFNDEKVIIQRCPGSVLGGCIKEIPKNIAASYSYTGTPKEGYYRKKVNNCIVAKARAFFTIDQSDYDRAIPIKK
jgi:hypothetical protein